MNVIYSYPIHNYRSNNETLESQIESSFHMGGNIINIQCNNFTDVSLISNVLFQANKEQKALPITLNQYMEYWLENFKYKRVEPSTYTRLVNVYKKQIHNTIGQMYIGDITSKIIQDLIDEYAFPTDENGLALAKSGLQRLMQLLKPCFENAVDENLINTNPCKRVKLPSQSYIKKETKEQFSLSDKELVRIKEAALKRYKSSYEYVSRDAIVLLFLLNTGLRVGELLALEWDDIDLDERIVHINKTLQTNVVNFENWEVAGYSNRIKKSTKTMAGVRVIPLNDTTVWYIQELKAYDKRHGIRCKHVVATRNGTRVTARNLQRSLTRLMTRAKIFKRVGLHTFRHTYGSTLLRRGVPIEVVSSLMGHANISITYNKYIHVLNEERVKAVDSVIIC